MFSVNDEKRIVVHPNYVNKRNTISKYDGLLVDNLKDDSMKYMSIHYKIFCEKGNIKKD